MAGFGLRPVRMRGGRNYEGGTKKYYITGTHEAIGIGSPVVKTGDMNSSVIKTGLSTYDIGTLHNVTGDAASVVGDGLPLTGVVVSIEPIMSDLSLTYVAADATAVLNVCDDPDVIFELQASAAITAANSVGLNGVLYNAGVNTGSGISSIQLDATSDTPAADASNQVLILGPARRPTLDYTDKPVFEVLIINHTESQANLSIGIS